MVQVDPVTRVMSIALMAIKGADQMDVEPIVQTISFVLVGNVPISFVSTSVSGIGLMWPPRPACRPLVLSLLHVVLLPQEFS